MKKILVVNGPNLNMLGKRPKEHYGTLTLDEINEQIVNEGGDYFDFIFFQSNFEGEIITVIQKNLDVDAIIINAAGYTHTSVAIRDALELFEGPIVEVHLSDIDNREDFRKVNLIKDVCLASFCGKKIDSYLDAVKYLKSFYNLIY